MSLTQPRYIKTKKTGLMAQKIQQARAMLERCRLCPRNCNVNRPKGETGICKAPGHSVVSSFSPHFGEEPPITGINGSGTIFFTHCNLRCRFCQNYDISIQGRGEPATSDQLAAVMLHLQSQGCHNINTVTPTHMVPFILEALDIAIDNNLTIPIVYNSSGYETLETLQLLDGIVDIYMPDLKFRDSAIADQACQAPDYPDIARIAVKEMQRQVGDLKTDDRGIATTGLLVRHLVLPEDRAGTKEIMTFLANEVSPNTHVNVMSQYRPMWQANKISGFNRSITPDEFHTAKRIAKDLGLNLIR